jgi:uncharacterized protein YbaP (TraB family)
MKMKMSFPLMAAILFAGCLPATDNRPASGSVSERVQDARDRNDGPAIWIAKDFDSTLYLFGTVHLLPDDLVWQRDDMRRAFDEAGTIFFEVDTGPESQVDATVLTTSLGLRSDGARLSETLDNYQRNLMEAAVNNGDLTIAALDAMQPWLASEYLTFAAAQNAGLSAELSADEALKSRAARNGKNIIYLESLETQIRASADLPEFIQLDILTETMERFNTLGDDALQIADQWSIGGTAYLTDKLIRPMKARAPEVFNSLLRDRNRAWVSELARFMDDSGTGFVAVGTAHLLGEDSLLYELREQGYEVQRYYAFKGENVIETVDTSIERTPKNPTSTPQQ